ncbi:MAG: deoxynucleoside kinase [Pseudomonadota bacterium]|jgi:deoxyguanosine kinase|nr:deoxynucleoside kinase [Pseudomonadota bacterium]MEC8000604.1 deoxynucleoside kinase [Pseudomonadota bacterium]|tara:strand:- start:616 stop:1281 length:666 start_codon:yes stop_codon:yes gene_type:complete
MKLAYQQDAMPDYIAVEGPIGVGKTTLANKLASNLNYDILLEMPIENPFLENSYRNPNQSALAAQLFFLFQRVQQLEELKQKSIFEPVRIADFILEKDRLFAEANLNNEEMRLYDKVYEHITIDAPIPDLVIYLQAPVEVLMARIERRGLKFERYLTQEYLTKINDAYSRFFLDYDKSPVLIINAAEIDFESSEDDLEMLITKIMSNPKGKTFINLQPSIF